MTYFQSYRVLKYTAHSILVKDIGLFQWRKNRDVTTFVTSRGLMRFRVMPFGMVNSGSTYNRMMRKLLDGTQSLENYVIIIIFFIFLYQLINLKFD